MGEEVVNFHNLQCSTSLNKFELLKFKVETKDKVHFDWSFLMLLNNGQMLAYSSLPQPSTVYFNDLLFELGMSTENECLLEILKEYLHIFIPISHFSFKDNHLALILHHKHILVLEVNDLQVFKTVAVEKQEGRVNYIRIIRQREELILVQVSQRRVVTLINL